MRIRSLVPALACLAAAPLATAGDSPAVSVGGFVDSILSASSLIDSDPEASASNTEFTYAAKLGVSAAISEKVSAQVDLFTNGEADEITVAQAYGVWKVQDNVELKTGKFISDPGWVSFYAPASTASTRARS
jgi:hypothetical protein